MTTHKTTFSLLKPFLSTAGLIAIAMAFVSIPSATHADTVTRYMSVGAQGNDVSSVQTFLAADPTLYPQGLVTGYYGFLTKSAVSNFQSRNGISPVGSIGPITLPVLNAQMNGSMNTGIDKRAPSIGYVQVNTSATTASLAWSTDEGASALVYYSQYPINSLEATEVSMVNIGGTAVISNINIQSVHSVAIAGLQPNTNYNYVVYVRDANGNETVTNPSIFHTSN